MHGGELERRIELVKGPANAALDLLLLEESDGDAGGRLDEPTRRVFEAFRSELEWSCLVLGGGGEKAKQ